MGFLSAIRVALDALLVNKGRSVLTSLGIVIGISAVIAMVAAGGGARLKLDERLETVGKNLILIRAGARTQQGMVADFVPLTLDDSETIRKEVGSLLIGAAAVQMTQRLAQTRTGKWPTTVVGSSPDMQRIRNWQVPLGHFYTEDDVKKMATVCLLGNTVRRHLLPDSPNPVGEWIRIDNLQFRVIGVLGEKGRSPTGADQDDQIFVPITTFQRRLAGEDKIGLITAAARSETVLDHAKSEIIRVLRERHHLKPGAPDDFDVSTVREMAELAEILTATMQILVGVIASISLVVGGIGIMNIMLVSVTERTREIGIRMAVGATGADVLAQFLIEAVVLALVGGLIGITLGIAAAAALGYFADWPVVVSPFIVLLSFVVSAGVGIFFGYYPALKASRLDPIDALRYE
ncbi:MAG TPA: ABC transporter permease [Gemmataceae bacterium]|nr:ABC transporter permease [Gemmataceae bacterium]